MADSDRARSVPAAAGQSPDGHPVLSRLVRVVFLLTLPWTLFVLIAVAVVQQPEALKSLPDLLAIQGEGLYPSLATSSSTMWSLAAGGLVALSALALGEILVRRLSTSPGRKLLAAWLIGLGASGTGWWVIASIQVPPPWVVALISVATLLYWMRRRPAFSVPDLSAPTWIALGAALGISLGFVMLPDYSWDGRFYHLVVPASWIENGRAVMWQQAPHFNFPHLIEGLFLPALLLGTDSSAKLQHWIFLPLSFGLLWDLAGGANKRGASEWALRIASGIPMMVLLAGWAYSDLALAAFTVAAVWAIDCWREERQYGWIVIAGAAAGFALGVKYTAFLVPLVGLILLWLAGAREVVTFGRFSVSAAIAGGTWYLRNLIVTGNPVYPFVLGGPAWDSFRASWYRAGGTGVGGDILTWLQVPWLTTLGLRDANFYDGHTGPLFLSLIPLTALILLLRRETGGAPRASVALFISASVLSVLFLAGIADSAALWQSRFLLPILLLVTPLIAWTVEQLPDFDPPFVRLSFLIRTLIWLWIGIAFLFNIATLLSFRPLPVTIGGVSREMWLSNTLGAHYETLMQLDILPANSRVILLYEPRSLGARRPVQPDAIFDEFPWRLHRASGDTALIADQMREEGFTHVALSWDNVERSAEIQPDFTTPERVAALRDFIRNETTLLWTSSKGEYALYELDENR